MIHETPSANYLQRTEWNVRDSDGLVIFSLAIEYSTWSGPRNPARGVLNFVVTLATHKDVRSYPCRSMESAIKLVERSIAGVTKPRPAAPQPEATPAPAAEPVAA